MRIVRVLSLVGLVASLSLAVDSGSAWAGKATTADKEKELPKIELTNISEFDSVFSKAKTIQDTLDQNHADLATSREKLNTTLGIATDAPLATALADLKTKASGKIKVAMKGGRPSLEPSEAVPDNVKAGIDAANALLDQAEKTVATAKQLLPEATSLVGACADFPGKIPGLVSDPVAVVKVTKTVGQDIKAIAATPDRINRMIADVEAMFNDVKGAFIG